MNEQNNGNNPVQNEAGTKKTENKKFLWLILAAVMFVILVVSCILIFQKIIARTDRNPSETTPDDIILVTEDATTTEPQETATSEAVTEEQKIKADVPVDFDYLKSVNSEIYAWIKIPGTVIDYPIAQSAIRNDYYLRRDIYTLGYSIGGCIFTENFNSLDFTDANTLIYGHSGMADGSFFTQLQLLSGAENFTGIRKIIIYTPEKSFEYEIFAAVPFSDVHIMRKYDFTTESGFNSFIDAVYSTVDTRAQFLEGYSPVFGEDRIITLSTCLDGKSDRRFLVLAYLENEYENAEK